MPQDLESIVIDRKTEVIHSFTFFKTKIPKIKLPSFMKIIGDYAYGSYTCSVEFTEGAELEKIGNYAFWCCISYIKLPKVKCSIGKYIFVNFPKSMEILDDFDPKVLDIEFLLRFFPSERIKIIKGKGPGYA